MAPNSNKSQNVYRELSKLRSKFDIVCKSLIGLCDVLLRQHELRTQLLILISLHFYVTA